MAMPVVSDEAAASPLDSSIVSAALYVDVNRKAPSSGSLDSSPEVRFENADTRKGRAMRRKKMSALTVGVVLLFVVGGARPAQAQYAMNYNGGPIKNLYIDLIFWGTFTQEQQQNVFDYVTNLSSFLRGAYNPAGFEPAVHYYGASDIIPGVWVAGTTNLFGYAAGQAQPGLDEVSGMVQSAWAGAYGAAYDYNRNYVSSSLPKGTNRLPVVVTNGATSFDDYGTFAGFHDSIGSYPYASAQFESLAVLSHEIFEAMTDPGCHAPVVFSDGAPGWSAGTLTSFYEVGDQCENRYSFGGNFAINNTYQLPPVAGYPWTLGYYGLASITINPAYNIPYSFPQVSCEPLIPEQNAPMSATFEYGGNGTQPLVLYYLTTSGHLAGVSWGNAGYSVSGPADFGQPSPSVTAVGRPAVVFSMNAGGEYVYTRGSDGALWMFHNGKWTSLGGLIFGDPSPIVQANGQIIDVFVLGTDDHLYWYGMANNTLWGWSAVPNPKGFAFVGAPTAIYQPSKAEIDIFATDESGQVDWVSDSSAGWAESHISGAGSSAMTSPPGVSVEQGTGNVDVLATDGGNMWEIVQRGSNGWNARGDWLFQLPYPQYLSGLQGTPAVVSSQSGRTDVFAVSRYGELYWWYSTTPTAFVNGVKPNALWNVPLVASGVVGSPIAVSRGSGEMEVFYRQTDGTLKHLTYNAGSWNLPGETVHTAIQ
jgi:hypothetical protein